MAPPINEDSDKSGSKRSILLILYEDIKFIRQGIAQYNVVLAQQQKQIDELRADAKRTNSIIKFLSGLFIMLLLVLGWIAGGMV